MNLKHQVALLLPEWLLQLPKNIYYSYILRDYDETRKPEFEIMRRVIKSHDMVLDIGANIGIYTVVLADIARHGRVYSFEPVPTTYKVLRFVVRMHRLTNVTPVQRAVSDSERTVGIDVPRYNDGVKKYAESKIVSDARPAAKARHRAGVRAYTCVLDEMFKHRSQKIRFIKCDIEGHEWFCLKGAKNVLEQDRPVLYLEVTKYKSEIFEYLKKCRYRAFYLSSQNVLREANTRTKAMNYFFIPEETTSEIVNQDAR